MSLKSSKNLANSIPSVGDVVLIKENLSHGRWRAGVMCELIRGKHKMI